MKQFSAFLLLSVFTIISFGAKAQFSIGNSPLSEFGFGDQAPGVMSRNLGMGLTGVSHYSVDHQNTQNPALLFYNRVANLEMSLLANNKIMRDDRLNTQRTFGGGVNSLGLSFPVTKSATVSIGMMPYSYVDYKRTWNDSVALTNEKVKYNSFGTGGLSRAWIATGIRVSQPLTLGLEVSYLFGSVLKSREVHFYPLEANSVYSLQTSSQFNELTFKPGFSFRKRIDTTRNIYLGIAGTWQPQFRHSIIQEQYLENKNVNDLLLGIDTVATGRSTTFVNPTAFNGGVSLGKPLWWTVALEGTYRNSAAFREGNLSSGLTNSWSINLGAEFTNNPNKPSYLSIVTLRAGAWYSKTPYRLNNQDVFERAASVGATLPIVRKEARYTRPVINLAFVYGQRGLASTNGFAETFWRFAVGFTLNDTQWFRRYRVE